MRKWWLVAERQRCPGGIATGASLTLCPSHRDAVERIRHKLAEKNRYLSGDEAYLLRTKAS